MIPVNNHLHHSVLGCGTNVYFLLALHKKTLQGTGKGVHGKVRAGRYVRRCLASREGVTYAMTYAVGGSRNSCYVTSRGQQIVRRPTSAYMKTQ